MKKRSTFVGGLAFAAFLAAGPAAGAAVTHTTMKPVTEKGKFVKLLSSSSFTMTIGKTSYVVKTNDMTHVTLDNKKVALSKLKKGDTITAKGPLEMHTVSATTVTAGM